MSQLLLPALLLPRLLAVVPVGDCERYGELPLPANEHVQLDWNASYGVGTLGPVSTAEELASQLELLRPELVWRVQRRGQLLEIEPARRAAALWVEHRPRGKRLILCVLRRLAPESPLFEQALLPLPPSLAHLPDGPLSAFASAVQDAALAGALKRGDARGAGQRAEALLQQEAATPGQGDARHVCAWRAALSSTSRLGELRDALLQAPGSPLRVRTSYLMARAELEAGHATIARELVEPELAHAPAVYRLLLLALLAQVPGASTAELERMTLRSDAAGASALAWLGVARWAQGAQREGAALLLRAEERQPALGTRHELALLLAEAHRILGNTGGALRRLSRVVQAQGPQCALALARIVDIHAQQGHIAPARRALLRCRDVLPSQAPWLELRRAELDDAASRPELDEVYRAALREPALRALRPELRLRLALGLYQRREEGRALRQALEVPTAPTLLIQTLTRAAMQRAALDGRPLQILRIQLHTHDELLGPDEQRLAAGACAELALWPREIAIRTALLRRLGEQAPVDDVLALARAYRNDGNDARYRMTLRFLDERGALPPGTSASALPLVETGMLCPSQATYAEARCLASVGRTDRAQALLPDSTLGRAQLRALQTIVNMHTAPSSAGSAPGETIARKERPR
ncbi:MAG: hypothetical protein ABIJ09_18050 [Pseudomonadota bacterium]